MKLLAVLLVAVASAGLAAGFSPAFIHHLKRQDVQQFGKCSLDETQDIFLDYPNQCYTAFASLKEAFENNSNNQMTYQDLYTQLCTQQCTDQIKTFAQVCEVPEYTDPFLHACDQNTVTGDFCLAARHSNDGTQAATDCYTALSTGKCSESCKASLEQLQTDLGCCVNSLFNSTTYGLDKLGVASHELWELCQVSEMPQCSNSVLALSGGTSGLHSSFITLIALFTFIQTIVVNVV